MAHKKKGSTYSKEGQRSKEKSYLSGVPRRSQKRNKGEGESKGGTPANKQW
jgi:hypothetical protein|tara:strand:+ start:31 stop:183 length:153 start_codon:yes stop_codon:yes gene_type:complete